MSIKQLTLTCLLTTVPSFAVAGEERAPCPIVPRPKQYRDSGTVATLQAPDAAAIVIGSPKDALYTALLLGFFGLLYFVWRRVDRSTPAR